MSSTTPFTERAALDAVMAAERALGRDPVQLPPGHAGYDIESRTPDGSLLFIEVMCGKASGNTCCMKPARMATSTGLNAAPATWIPLRTA